MAKRQLRYFISLMLFLLFIVLVGQRFFRLPLKKVSLFEAVPVTAPLFIHISDFNPATIPDTVDVSLQAWLALLAGVEADFELIRSLMDTVILRETTGGNAVLILQKMDRNNWSMSLVLDLGQAKRKLEALLDKYADGMQEKTRFKNQIVYKITSKEGPSFSLGAYRNLLIIGRLPIAVEDVIRQLDDYPKNRQGQSGFKSVGNSSKGAKIASIYLQSGFFSDFLRHQMEPRAFQRLQEMETTYKGIKFDIQTFEGQWQLPGQLVPALNDKKLRAFAGQKAQVPETVFRLIPEDIALFYYWGFSNFQKYYDDLQPSVIDRFERFIKPWVGREMMQVVVDPAANSTCMLIRTKDPELAKHSLDRLLGEAGQLKAYQYNTFQVQQVLEEDLFSFLPFGPLTALQNPHIVFLEDYVLFAPSQSAMEIWLDQYVVGNTLVRDADFIRFRESHSGAFHHLLYFNAKHWPSPKNMSTLGPFLDRFPYAGLGLKEEGGIFQLDANWMPAVASDTTGNILWRVNLAAEAILAPALTTIGKEHKQVVVTQDAFYNFYVFEAGGDLLWQKKLDGPVFAPIHSFDYYSDGHHQMLFITQKSIYLFDEQGKAINNFPLPLRNTASSGLSFVDFKQENQPAFFVAGRNKQIYGFDARGKPLPGWNPLFDAGYLPYPLLHFQHGINDYLVALSDTAHIQVFAKNGTKRFEVRDSNAVFHSPPGFQLSERSNRIVAVDQKGIAHVLNLQGEYFRLALQVGKNESVQFAFADVVGNSDKDYIALSKKDLAVYHYATQGFVSALKHRFEQEQDSLFAIKVLNQQKSLIGTLDKKRRQIHLLDSKGRQMPGFPISGTTAFSVVDLYGDGRPVVLGANGASVFGMGVGVGRE